MNTYVGSGHRLNWTNGTGASVASGAVVALADAIGIAVTLIANGYGGAIEMDGVHDLPADATTAFVFGDQLWWDATLGKLYKTFAFGRVPAGLAAETKGSAGTSCETLINVNTVPFGRISEFPDQVLLWDDFLGGGYALTTPPANWTVIDVSSAGAPTILQEATHGGAVELKAATTDEAEVLGLGLNDKLIFDVDQLLLAVFRFRAPTLAAVDALVIGMASAYNVDPDSIAAGAWIRCIGAQDILCECDGNGAGDIDDQDSTLNLGNAVFCRLLMDFSNSASVKFYLTVNDGVTAIARVLSAVTFNISNYTAGLQPLFFTLKASGTAQNELVMDYVGVLAKRF